MIVQRLIGTFSIGKRSREITLDMIIVNGRTLIRFALGTRKRRPSLVHVPFCAFPTCRIPRQFPILRHQSALLNACYPIQCRAIPIQVVHDSVNI